MEVSGKFQVKATSSPGKESEAPTGREAGWAPEPILTRWRREEIHSLPLPGIEPR